jgi:hypothetical protein
LLIDETLQLTATVTPINADDRTVEWASSDEEVATVTQDGLVTAIGVGTADITATTNDLGLVATCAVTAEMFVPTLWSGTRSMGLPTTITGNRVVMNGTSVGNCYWGWSSNYTGAAVSNVSLITMDNYITLQAGDALKLKLTLISGSRTGNTSNTAVGMYSGLGGITWGTLNAGGGEVVYTATQETVVKGLLGVGSSNDRYTNYTFDIELYYKASGAADYVRWI